MNVGGDDRFDGGRFEGNTAGDCVIESAGEAVHVRKKIFAVALHFFGRDVIRRSPDRGFVLVTSLGFAGETEIGGDSF